MNSLIITWGQAKNKNEKEKLLNSYCKKVSGLKLGAEKIEKTAPSTSSSRSLSSSSSRDSLSSTSSTPSGSFVTITPTSPSSSAPPHSNPLSLSKVEQQTLLAGTARVGDTKEVKAKVKDLENLIDSALQVKKEQETPSSSPKPSG